MEWSECVEENTMDWLNPPVIKEGQCPAYHVTLCTTTKPALTNYQRVWKAIKPVWIVIRLTENKLPSTPTTQKILQGADVTTVSYTHLTLPTNREV